MTGSNIVADKRNGTQIEQTSSKTLGGEFNSDVH